MTTPKEALELAKPLIDIMASNSAAGSFEAKRAIDQALASLQGEDAVERVAQALLDRFIERSKCRSLSGKPTFRDGTKITELPASYRDDFEADARAILATGFVPDEATVRADEREKCAKVAVARSDAVMAEAEAAHDDDNYDLYERLECEAGNYMDLAAAIRSGGSDE